MKVKELVKATKGLLREEYSNSGVLEHTENIFATYFLEDERIKSVQVFATAFVSAELDVQVAHTLDLLEFITSTLRGLCELTDEEVNQTLHRLGLFDNTIKEGKELVAYDYLLKAEAKEGLILFTVAEI